MSLWVDKHRPLSLDKLDIHPHITAQLQKLAESGDFPHITFYGPNGAGKKTRIMAVLREIYGPSVSKMKIDQKIFLTASNTKIELNVISSNYHIEVNPSDVGIHDRIIIQDLIKEIAQTQQVDLSSSRSFKVVVIHEADLLTREAQSGLRRTMEKYTKNLRIIFVCENCSKLIAPLRSRCLLIRVPSPSEIEICQALQSVCGKENLKLPAQLANTIASKSERNLRKAILMLEACRVQKYPFDDHDEVPVPDWQMFIQEIARMIVSEQSPKRLHEVRGKIYELLVHCIPPTEIIKNLAMELIKLTDSQLAPEVIQEAAFYEHRIQTGQKAIFHLEAFVAKFMSMYKKVMMEIMV